MGTVKRWSSTRWARAIGVVVAFAVAGCPSSAGGQAGVSQYSPPDVSTVGVTQFLAAAGTAPVMALSPDGRTAAVLRPSPAALCLTTADKADQPGSGRCLTEAGIGRSSNLVSFSPDGTSLLVVPNAQVMSTGPIYLITVRTATARAIPAPDAAQGGAWMYGTWNSVTGGIVTMSRAAGTAGALQLDGVDPATGNVTSLGPAVDAKQFPGGQPLTAGKTVLYPLLTSGSRDQPDLMVFDLDTHRPRVLVDVEPAGKVPSQYLVLPLALSPDGARAVVAVISATDPSSSSGQVLDLATGTMSAITGTVFPVGAAFSPDGSTIALLRVAERKTQLFFAQSDGTAGRSAATITNTGLPAAVSMQWSRSNTLTLNSVGGAFPAALAGWSLH